jgi:hypothetical protein
MPFEPTLLTDPFLQCPTDSSVRVVWFTEFAGIHHTVGYGVDLSQIATAKTIQMSRMREDGESTCAIAYSETTIRPIWRHEAEVTGLIPGQRIPYRVTSVREDGARLDSTIFTLAARPLPGTPLKLLLTSDHQLKPMVAANLQKVVETIGQVDAVLFAGDMVNVPDRASEWFDDRQGGAFFPNLQGRANYELEHNGTKTCYRGGALIQAAPIYSAIGNHEVMGRFASDTDLHDQFEDAVPRLVAERLYAQNDSWSNSTHDPAERERWLQNHSFNIETYTELFTLPESQSGGKTYYAVSFGDLRLVVLYATSMWRIPGLADTARGRYRERAEDFDQPENWGYGQHLFGAIAAGSPQYAWLERELNSPTFQQARYKIVMLHHPIHSLGGNIVPAYTDPMQTIERSPDGAITAIRYHYPRQADHLVRDVLPLLEAAGVQLVFYGHSHLWNRFVSPSGLHFLETSNVGNSYGAHVGTHKRSIPSGSAEEEGAIGNPNGLEPVTPTIAPLLDSSDRPLPYIASNEITVFSIFDTDTGTINSYRFDTRNPDSPVIKFDQFTLNRG